MTTHRETRADVVVYALGICACSVCAPADLAENEVIDAVNVQHPTGLDHGWSVSDPEFRTGEANPASCNAEPDARRHWLLTC